VKWNSERSSPLVPLARFLDANSKKANKNKMQNHPTSLDALIYQWVKKPFARMPGKLEVADTAAADAAAPWGCCCINYS
jgi:hypothetical protein